MGLFRSVLKKVVLAATVVVVERVAARIVRKVTEKAARHQAPPVK